MTEILKKNIVANSEISKIVIVGRVPPPPGGVGASINSIMEALTYEPNIEPTFIKWTQLWRIFTIFPDIIHFNFSRPIKRLLGTLLGRVVGSKIVHTVHSNQFEFENYANIISIYFSHGYILLNQDIYDRFAQISCIKTSLMTPIIKSTRPIEIGNLDNEISDILKKRNQNNIAVIYAHSRDYRNGVETYGLKFVAELLPQLKKLDYYVVFLDTQGEYETAELDPYSSGNAIHIKREVNFLALLNKATVFLRPTSTDGNSVAVLEAIKMGIPVIASDSVCRPINVIKYNYEDADSFISAIKSIDDFKINCLETAQQTHCLLTSSNQYIQFLAKL